MWEPLSRQDCFSLLLLCYWFLLLLLLMWTVSVFRDLKSAGYFWCTLACVKNICWYASVMFLCYCVIYEIFSVTFPVCDLKFRTLWGAFSACEKTVSFCNWCTVFIQYASSFNIILLPSAGKRVHLHLKAFFVANVLKSQCKLMIIRNDTVLYWAP